MEFKDKYILTKTYLLDDNDDEEENGEENKKEKTIDKGP